MSDTREVETIYADNGTILLGTQEAVEDFVAEEYGEGYGIKSMGWMHNVGWDRETYRLKRTETKNMRPAWEIVRPGRAEAHREAPGEEGAT